MTNRLISPDLIPNTLWDNTNKLLHLPPQLVSTWTSLLHNHKLYEQALEKGPDKIAGGITKKATDEHLVWRFTGSCARIMLALLDPNNELLEISDSFIQVFSGNKVFLADLPCGSGAGAITILSVLCELRRQKRLPRIPLEITILGGEISEYARVYAKESITHLIPELEKQAITVSFELISWDVCDKFSNTDLIKQLTLKSQNCPSKYLLVANFSNLLERDKKWDSAKNQLEELFRHSRSENSIAIWIEPQTNTVSSFITRLIKWFEPIFSKFFSFNDNADQQNPYSQSSIVVKDPLKEGGIFRNHLTIIRFELPLQKKL